MNYVYLYTLMGSHLYLKSLFIVRFRVIALRTVRYRYTAIYSDTSHFYFHVVTFVLDTSLRQSRETKFVDFLL